MLRTIALVSFSSLIGLKSLADATESSASSNTVLHCLTTLNSEDDSNATNKGSIKAESEASLPCINGEESICIRYTFLDKSVAGCYPKKYQDLTTCEFVSSFGSNVCCCDDHNNCNTKSCSDSSLGAEKLYQHPQFPDGEKRRDLGKVCSVDQPSKFKAQLCHFPFTYVDNESGASITFNDCASMDEAMPFNGIENGYNGNMWCPLKSGVDDKGQYVVQSEATRENWGTCNCFENKRKDCQVGEFNGRFGPARTGNCKLPFRVVDSFGATSWFYDCVPLSIYRPFAADAFNLLKVKGASWCPLDDGVSGDGVYHALDTNMNLNWGLCSVCTDSTKPPVDTQAPSLSPTSANGEIIVIPPKEAGSGAYELYEYGAEYEKPTNRPTTRAPAGTTNFPTTAAPAGTPVAAPTTPRPTTRRPTTAAPVGTPVAAPTTPSPTTRRPTTPAPQSGTPSPTRRPTTKSPTPVTSSPTTQAPGSNPTTRSPTTRSPTTRRPTTKSPFFPTKPTIAPSIVPTVAPSIAPTDIPTTQGGGSGGSGGRITEMDIYIHADMSRSISMANPACVKESGKKCWNLQVDFTDSFQSRLAAQLGGYAGKFPNSKGLRVWLSTFTCGRGKPITNVLLPLSGVQADIDMAIEQMFLLKPYMGTCPTQGLNMILKSLKDNIENTSRQNKAVIILTDGNFDKSDSASASSVTKQMVEMGVEIFAIAVGKAINTKRLRSVTHDNSGSRIISIDSFSSLAQSGPQMVRAAMALFEKPVSTTGPSNPPTLSPTNAPISESPSISPTNRPTSLPTTRIPTEYPTPKAPTPYPTKLSEAPTSVTSETKVPSTPELETDSPTAPEIVTDAPTPYVSNTDAPTPHVAETEVPTTSKSETSVPTPSTPDTENPTTDATNSQPPTPHQEQTLAPTPHQEESSVPTTETQTPTVSVDKNTEENNNESNDDTPIAISPLPVALISSFAFAGILFIGFTWRRRRSSKNISAAEPIEKTLSTAINSHSVVVDQAPAMVQPPLSAQVGIQTPTNKDNKVVNNLIQSPKQPTSATNIANTSNTAALTPSAAAAKGANPKA